MFFSIKDFHKWSCKSRETRRIYIYLFSQMKAPICPNSVMELPKIAKFSCQMSHSRFILITTNVPKRTLILLGLKLKHCQKYSWRDAGIKWKHLTSFDFIFWFAHLLLVGLEWGGGFAVGSGMPMWVLMVVDENPDQLPSRHHGQLLYPVNSKKLVVTKLPRIHQ